LIGKKGETKKPPPEREQGKDKKQRGRRLEKDTDEEI